jgi:hypothetical protein
VIHGDWPVELEEDELKALLARKHELSVYMIAITANKR